jgi:hypothetical protein
VLRALKGKEEADLFAGLTGEAGLNNGAENPQSSNEADARRLAQRLALTAAGTALKQSAPSVIADTFLKTRVKNMHGVFYGTSGLDSQTVDLLLRRVLSEV